MNTRDIAEAGFNIEQIRQVARRGALRSFMRWSAAALLFCGIIWFAMNYLANLPRERNTRKFSYLERVANGAQQWWTSMSLGLSVPEFNPKSTSLPVVELYVRGDRMDKLRADLPKSGDEYQSAQVKFDHEAFKADARFRGDSINHWAFPAKSWRVKLKGSKMWEGMQYINLNLPRSSSQLENWLGYTIAHRMGGFLVPYADIVQLRLNRKYDGIRLRLEQPNEDFLTKRGLPQGKLYVGDIDTAQIYSTARAQLFSDPKAWEIRSEVLGEGVTPVEMEELVRILSLENDPQQQYTLLRGIIDIESTLKYMAMLEMVGSGHIDETHNQKYYFNPVSGRFVPIAWDTVAYMEGNTRKLDSAPNKLFRVILSIPELRERKDRILWQAIGGSFAADELIKMVKDKADEIRPDVQAFPHKLHASDKGVHFVSNEEWESALKSLQGTIKERNKYIYRALSPARLEYSLTPATLNQGTLTLRVTSRPGVKVKSLEVKVTGASPNSKVEITRLGVNSIGREVATEKISLIAPVKSGTAQLALGDHLFSNRKIGTPGKEGIIPAAYTYSLRVIGKGSIETIGTIDAVNSISGESATVDNLTSDAATVTSAQAWFEPDRFAKRKEVVLQGTVNVKEDIVVDEYTKLIIEPGTHLRLAPRVSVIVLSGALDAQGTAQRPIVFEQADPHFPWGVLGINSAKDVKLSYVTLRGGSERNFKFVKYEGMLSVHESVVEASHLNIHGGYITARQSRLAISDSTVTNVTDRAIESENSTIADTRLEHIREKPMHGPALKSSPAHGTPAHIEREFKYSIRPNGHTLEEIARQMTLALTEEVKNLDQWQAPKFTGYPFTADAEAADFAYRDIYFDTPDNLLVKHDVSYRARNRYRNLKTHDRNLKNPTVARFWPFRLEFQAKVGREHPQDGFSVVDEARFEFRKQSKPFSEQNLPPNAPWDFDEFIPWFQTGTYKGIVTTSGQAVYNYMVPQFIKNDSFHVEPRLVVITQRVRQHLNIKSDWGSGPNPEQSYIITVDDSRIYKAEDYLGFMRARKFADKQVPYPTEAGQVVEMELEFERNVSDKLDKDLAAAEAAGNKVVAERLSKARDAFLADQKTIMTVITKHLAKIGVDMFPAGKSKYLNSFDIVFNGGSTEAPPPSAK